jgi:type IV pilus assembly protein PilV
MIKSNGMTSRNSQRGVTMIEVLVTIVIVVIGLLGLAGLQARIQTAEIESYQRVQAIVLMQDMVDRLRSNRNEATSYVATAGTGSTVTSASSGFQRDLFEWHNALLGASETDGSAKLGAMIGARGCISAVAGRPFEFDVAVAWQGLTPTAVPTVSACGAGQYGSNDGNRRVIATRVVFSCLLNAADGTTCVAAGP